jgi:shikimate dehydrogenase
MQLYGLVGYPLTHSFSQKYFTEKFAQLGMAETHAYTNFSIPSIEDLPVAVLQNKHLQGFNVTIPYKKQILSFLHQQTPAVQAMGACNCVRIQQQQLIGYNTDIIGFEQSLKPFLKQHHTKALILGTGGAAAAVEYVLKQLGIQWVHVSRTPGANALSYDALDAQLMASHTLIINTSPVGQYPAVDDSPNIPYELITPAHHLYDLIYNPTETNFMKQGLKQGATVQNGYQMLVIQAEESWRIWNS